MATYDLNRSELNSLLASDHIDPSVRKSIIDYLQDDGLLTGHGSTVAVQESGYQSGNPATLDPTAQVLFVDTSPISVGTDPALKVIVDTADANLIVTGTTDVFVAMGKGSDTVDLSGSSGNDVVMTGSGNDTVKGGTGADSIYGGSGNDLLTAGGDHQLLVGGTGHDTLSGGTGNYDTLQGGSGSDELHAGDGNHQLLQGGSGHDTLFGGAGSFDTLSGGTGSDSLVGGSGANQLLQGNGGNDTLVAGTGGDTLQGGGGNDTFNVGLAGNDTIDGGGGKDTVHFADTFANAHITPIGGGVTQVQFTSGQTVQVSDVKELVFSDHHDVKL